MKKITSLAMAILIFSAIAGLVWYEYASRPVGGNREIDFTVNKGESLKSISGRLAAAGAIRSAFLFERFTRWNGLEGRLQAGDFKINPRQKIGDILNALLAAKRETRKVLIREGETLEEIAKVFEESGLFGAQEFLQAADSGQLLKTRYDFLSGLPAGKNLEGFLFPDTYEFFVGATPDQAVKKMLDNFEKRVTPELRDKAKSQGKSFYEVVILASIVEREVRKPEDMKIAAGIFWSRLARGQALQSDATLSYALKDTTAAHTAAQLETDTPYNSYKYPGLPPTPISNPGLNAIVAAIEPTATDYNFFLTSADGTVHYAATFAEHIRNKNKYLSK